MLEKRILANEISGKLRPKNKFRLFLNILTFTILVIWIISISPKFLDLYKVIKYTNLQSKYYFIINQQNINSKYEKLFQNLLNETVYLNYPIELKNYINKELKNNNYWSVYQKNQDWLLIFKTNKDLDPILKKYNITYNHIKNIYILNNNETLNYKNLILPPTLILETCSAKINNSFLTCLKNSQNIQIQINQQYLDQNIYFQNLKTDINKKNIEFLGTYIPYKYLPNNIKHLLQLNKQNLITELRKDKNKEWIVILDNYSDIEKMKKNIKNYIDSQNIQTEIIKLKDNSELTNYYVQHQYFKQENDYFKIKNKQSFVYIKKENNNIIISNSLNLLKSATLPKTLRNQYITYQFYPQNTPQKHKLSHFLSICDFTTIKIEKKRLIFTCE